MKDVADINGILTCGFVPGEELGSTSVSILSKTL